MDLGTVLVTFAADVQEFNDAMTGVVDQMNQVQSASQNMSAASSSGGGFFSALQTSASNVRGAVGEVGTAVEEGAGKVASFAASFAQGAVYIREFGSAAIQTVASIFSTNSAVDKMQVTFTSLLGSGKAATDMLKRLADFASSSPFEFADISAAGQKLLSMKTSANMVIPELTAIGDAVSGIGKGQATFDLIVAKMGVMTETGKVSSLAMNAIAKQGIDSWGMLAKAIGTDVPTAMSMVKKGAIDGKTAVDALTVGMEHAFSGQMTAQANTFSGTLVRMKNSAEEAWLAFSGGAFQTAKSSLQSLETLISSPKFVEFATVMGTVVGGAISKLAALLSSALGPPIALLITNIGKVVTYFSEWAAKSTIAHVAMNLIGLAVVGIVNGLGLLLTGLATLVGLFADTGIKGDIARAVLVALGIVIAGFAIYALVGGLIAAGIAAWGFAAGIIAATWPILVIIAVIALIILAVQHWAEISKFLQAVWGAVVNWFQGVLHNVVAWFQSTWASIAAGVSGFFGGIGATIQGGLANIGNWFKNAWNGIISGIAAFFAMVGTAIMSGIAAMGAWFQAGLANIGTFFKNVWNGITSGVSAFFSFLGGLISAGMAFVVGLFTNAVNGIIAAFAWLYAHNYYFQNLVDGIRTVVSGVLAWLQSAWTATVSFVVNLWNGLVGFATNAFNAVGMGINTAVSATTTWIQTAWQACVSWLTGIWNGIASLAASTWATVSSAIQTAVSTATAWLQSAWSAASSFLSGIWSNIASVAQAAWNTITSAVQSAWSAITSTVQTQSSNAASFLQGVWNNVVSFLGGIWNNIVSAVQSAWARISGVFSSAWGTYVAGPLSSFGAAVMGYFSNLASQAFQWGANIIQGLVNGISSMIGAAGQAASSVMGAVSSYLGFHSPAKEGEGRYIEDFGQNMVQGFVTGMNKGLPLIQATMQHLVILPTAPIGSSQPPVSVVSASKQTQHIHIYLGAEEVASTLVDRVGDQLAQQVRMRMGVRV